MPGIEINKLKKQSKGAGHQIQQLMNDEVTQPLAQPDALEKQSVNQIQISLKQLSYTDQSLIL